ncbi:putative protein YqeN [Candidatus Entotheonellaceae bacterium PAL068K]
MPCVPATKVLKRLAAGQVDPLYLLVGAETYLMQDYISAYIEHILQPASRDFNCDVFNADRDTLPEALSVACMLPVMAPHRVVVLHSIHQLRKAELQQLEAYAAHPSEGTALICSSVDSNSLTYLTQFCQRAQVVECKPLKSGQRRAWVIRMVEQQGYTITPEAVQGFLEEQDNDLWSLAQEINKLCTYVGEAKQIRLTDVQAVGHASHLHSMFALSDAMGARQIVQALSVIDSLLQQGEPPLVIFSMMVRHVRLLWSIRQLVEQRSHASSIAKTLRLPQPVCRQLVAQSRLYTTERLRQLYIATIEADLAFKTSNKPPKAILERLVLDICSRS